MIDDAYDRLHKIQQDRKLAQKTTPPGFPAKKLALNKFGSEKDRILLGYIGENLVSDFLGLIQADTYDYDLLSNKGKRLEVKSISCKFKPKPHYLCTVNSPIINQDNRQQTDFYIFVRILADNSKGWILGYIKPNEFYEKGDFAEKGKDFGKFKFKKASATTLPISKLYRFRRSK